VDTLSDLPDSLEKRQSTLFRGNQPELPVAGFLGRGLAFVADIAFLGSVIYALIFVAKNALFTLGPFNSILFVVAALAYFTACDGPLFKGRTVGKVLSGIRTGDVAGEPLTWRAALLRSIVKLQFIVLQPPLIFIKYHIEQVIDLHLYTLAAVSLYGIVLFVGVIAFALHMGLSTSKQAPHDLLAGSLVFKLNETATIGEIEGLYSSPQLFDRMRRAAIKWSTVISLGLLAMLAWMSLRNYGVTMKGPLEFRKQLLINFELLPHGYPIDVVNVRIPEQSAGTANDPVATADAATSGPADTQGLDRLKLRIVYRYNPNVSIAELSGDRERLEAQLRRFSVWFVGLESTQEILPRISLEGFQLSIIRQIPLIIWPYTENVILIDIPAQEAEGPIAD
jgi:uncharacterized RDD family membrane protein YckC